MFLKEEISSLYKKTHNKKINNQVIVEYNSEIGNKENKIDDKIDIEIRK